MTGKYTGCPDQRWSKVAREAGNSHLGAVGQMLIARNGEGVSC